MYRREEVRFLDTEGRILRKASVLVPEGAKWSPAQIESVARLQLREYAAKAVIVGAGYTATPQETKESYMIQDTGFALWCKPGRHAFDPSDPGRKRMQYTDYSGDQPEDLVAWTCSEHSPDMVRKAPELPRGADEALYTEFLQWKAGLASEPIGK